MSILSDIINVAKEVVEVARTTAQGMSVTFSHIPTRKETIQYPDEPVQIYRRFRGEHFLDVDEDGKENASPVSSAPRPVRRTPSISKAPKTSALTPNASGRIIATPRSTRSITAAAFSA